MTTSDQNNQRRNTRVEFDTRITIRTDVDEFHIQGHSRDVSLKGVFVNTDLDIPMGTKCIVEIHLTGVIEDLTLNMSGEILRKEEQGLAILFNSMDLDSYTHLKNIVRYNTSNPDKIQ